MKNLRNISLSLSFLFLLLPNKETLAQSCRLYIPQPIMFGKQYWENSKRPASECETEFARTCYDSLLSAFAPIYKLGDSFMKLSEPDTLKRFYALRIPEDMSDEKKILVEDYFQVTAESERSIFIAVPGIQFNYRKDDTKEEFNEINKVRLKQREQLGKVAQKAKSTGASTSPEMESILLQLANTDADFWAENSFEIHTYFNSGASYDSDLKLKFKGKASYSLLPDSTLLLHIIKSKDIDPKQMLDGNVVPEDLIDEWYYLLGNWGTPEITQDGEDISVIVARKSIDWKGLHPNMLTTHYLVVKIKSGEKLNKELYSLINWSPLKALLY